MIFIGKNQTIAKNILPATLSCKCYSEMAAPLPVWAVAL